MKKLINYFVVTFITIFVFSGCSRPAHYVLTEEGNLPKLKVELNSGKYTKDDIQNLLEHASFRNQLPIVKYLVEEKEANPNGKYLKHKNMYNHEPLRNASILGLLDMVKYLVQSGADVNGYTQKSRNHSLIHNVTIYPNLDVVKYLVENGADINWRNSKGENAYESTRSFYPGVDKIREYLKNEAPLVQERIKKQKELALAKKKKEEEQRKLQKEREQQIQIDKFVQNQDYQGLKAYTQKYPGTVYYISSPALRLALTGPSGLKVGDIRKLVKDGEDELIILSLIKRVKTPYKQYTLDEIKVLKKMGLSSKIISTMMDVTTQLLRDENLKKEQEFYLAEQKRIANEKVKTEVVYKSNNKVDAQGNPIIQRAQDELMKKGVSMLLDQLF